MGWDGSQDSIHCFDAALGQLLWRRSYACGTIAQWPGPRATPTVAGGKVFTLGQHGQLRSHDAASGAQAWAVDLPASYKPDADYGFPWSPLVEGDHLILGAGSGGLALRAADGAFAWGNDGKPGACASPVRSEHEGRRAVALIANDGGKSVHLLGVDPASGAELWRSEPWPERWGAACVDPLVAGASIFLTTAEQQNGGVRYTIRGSRLTRDWMDRGLACYTGGCVLVGGHLFAVTKAGILKCVEWESGKEKWSRRGFDGHGALIAAGGFLIVQTSEQGDVVVVKADARGHEEVRRTRVFAGEPRTFTAPVLANGRLYCRSYAGEVVCLQVGETAAQRSSGISPDLGSEGGHR
jgi:outer membrane protein assembly factor BamB